MGNCSSASSITTSIDNVAHYHHPLPSGVLLTYSLPNEQDEQPTSSEQQQQQQQQQQMAPSQINDNNNESENENENDNNVESNDNNNNNDTADQDLIIQFEEMLRSIGVLDDFVRILREVPDSRSTFESFLEDFRRYLVQSNYNNAIDMGSTPPASKAIIQNLPKITLGEDKEENNDTIQIGEKEPCNICCECYTAEHSVTQLPCGHSFHTTCIESWLSRKCTCPICRYELPTDDQSFEVERKERMKSRSCNHHEEEQVGENNNNNNNGTIREQSSFTGVTTCG